MTDGGTTREPRGEGKASGESRDAGTADGWRAVFGHEEPYDEQAEGIETAVRTARESGFLALEGACGTGKTMLALTAGIHLVRDPGTDFERVVVLTSVKQQLRQFEADLRRINDDRPDGWRPVSALTLVGKADVCPYNRERRGGIDDGNVYERCDGLRERTRTLTDQTTAAALAERARSQQIGLADSGSPSGTGAASHLETAGAAAPYPPDTVEYDDSGGTEYCPFYAGYLADLPDEGDPVEAVPFDPAEQGVIDPETLVGLAVEHGSCPHSVMGALLPHVEVIVGNYYHAFDPTTVASFTGPLVDDETFVVCDEAHMLEPRVRDLVSDGLAASTLRDAERELARVVQPFDLGEDREARAGGDVEELRALIRTELAEGGVTLPEIRRTRSFLRDLHEELGRRVTDRLDADHPGWRDDPRGPDDDEIPLRDPAEPATDELTRWGERAGYDAGVWSRAEAVGGVVARVLDAIDAERGDDGENGSGDADTQRAAPAAGRTLTAWARRDHTTYFREIELTRARGGPEEGWRGVYAARLRLYNCLPRGAIGARLAEFGGGILMSATLAPLDRFVEVVGLDDLPAGRPVATRTYGLSFPPEHRASFAVATPKFTYDNRGPPDDEPSDPEAREVRRVYARALRQVARLPGNVLVGMPSYAEAEWAGSVLSDLDAPVLVDESTGDDATQALKESFFEGPPKVLVTSLRGTLTEGVDYRGDRLHAAVVCGVPIVNTASPRIRAVRTAYDRAFGDGFRDALAVPAVRKARQALGRVIRGPDERGARVLLDERYARDSWDSVRGLLGADREEFRPVSPDMLDMGLERFTSERE